MSDLRINPESANIVTQNVIDELSKMFWAQRGSPPVGLAHFGKELQDKNVEMDGLEHDHAEFAVLDDMPRGGHGQSNTSALLTINFSDPMNVSWSEDVRPKDASAELTKRIKATIDYVNDCIGPHPRNDGLWWADEDYYPIRPLLIGEEPDLKPEPWCTVVDGTTGEPINEAKSKPTRREEELVNEVGADAMSHNAWRRIRDWVVAQRPRKDLSFHWYVDDTYSDRPDVVVQVASKTNNPDEYFEFDVLVQLTDPMSPEAVLQTDDSNYDVDFDVARSVIEALEEVAQPMIVASNAWWVDEEMYPVRPVYEGESSEFPPKSGWTTVDPVSYDEVEVSERYDRVT